MAAHYRAEQPKLRINACNGLVEDILRDAGLPIRGAVRTLFADMKSKGWVHHRKVPFPGDVVFFDRTYDSNGNGRQDDKLSHIAVVISIDEDDTIHMVHRGSKGIRPLTMNLTAPSSRSDAAGKPINSWLGKPGYAKPGAKLAGELWAAFATPDNGRSTERLASANPGPTQTARAPAHKPKRPATTSKAGSPVASSRGRKPLTQAPLASDDTAFARVFSGKRLRARHVDGRSCLELWYLRNAIFARHGYAFRTLDARRAFSDVPGYTRKDKVNRSTVGKRLSQRDRDNLEQIQERERRCRR